MTTLFIIMYFLSGFIGAFIFRLSDIDFGIKDENILKVLLNPIVIGGFITLIISLIKMVKNIEIKDLL